jgi:hypothetical protein
MQRRKAMKRGRKGAKVLWNGKSCLVAFDVVNDVGDFVRRCDAPREAAASVASFISLTATSEGASKLSCSGMLT